MANLYRKHLAIILIVIMSLVVLPMTAFADDNKPLDIECQMAISYIFDETPISDAEFHIFKVGDIYEDYSVALTGEFADYDVDLNVAVSNNLHAAGSTLYMYASKDGIEPNYIVDTDENGKANLVGLDAGVYLVAGQPRVEGDDAYFTDPQLIFLPYNPTDEVVWNSNITIIPKATMRCILDPLDYKVQKVWQDTGAEKLRPKSITVRLMENGKEYNRVELSKENNWSYTWKELNPKSEWTLVEDVPKDYSAQIVLDEGTFVVKNTFEGEIPSDGKIPQTGLLWWPIPVMAFAGMVFVIAGLLVARKEKYEE